MKLDFNQYDMQFNVQYSENAKVDFANKLQYEIGLKISKSFFFFCFLHFNMIPFVFMCTLIQKHKDKSQTIRKKKKRIKR